MNALRSLSPSATLMLVLVAATVPAATEAGQRTAAAKAPQQAAPAGPNVEAAPANPNIEEREVFLRRDQTLAAAQQLAAAQAKQPQQQQGGGLAGLGRRLGRGNGVNLAEGAKALLQVHAATAAAVGTQFVIVAIGNEEDREKVRTSLAEVQTRTLLLYVNQDLQDTQHDHTPLKSGIPGLGSLTAMNIWFYKPSPGMAVDRAPDQVMPMRGASPKVWATLFAAAGDISMATTEVTKSLTSKPAAGNTPGATGAPAPAAAGGINVGDVLVPKIANVKVMATPSDTGKTVMTLTKADELVVIGAERDGFVQVQGASGEGWVKLSLFNKQP